MLQEWRLSQFKSVHKETFPIRPLTLFCGANSSGKSSVLHSILVVAQTLASKVGRHHLVLNGEYLRLGTFDEVVHQSSPDKTLSIGYTLLDNPEARDRPGRITARPTLPMSWRTYSVESIARLEVDLVFGETQPDGTEVHRGSSSLQAQLKSGTFQYTPVQGPLDASIQAMPLKLQTAPQDKDHTAALAQSAIQGGTSAVNISDFNYDVRLDRVLRSWLRQFRRHFLVDITEPLDIVSVTLQHFLPALMINRYRVGPRRLEADVEALRDLSETQARQQLNQWMVGKDPLRAGLAQLVLSHAQQQGVREFISSLVLPTRSSRSPGLFDSFKKDLAERIGSMTFDAIGFEYVPSPPVLQQLSVASVDFFASLRYLGPLRDDPKFLYSSINSSDPSDVGVKGQHTANVLDLFSSRMVDFVDPHDKTYTIVRATLEQAVHAWLSYFHIADNVMTREEGSLGHRLFIQPGGLRRHVAMPNVGVGVSQLLPIVVMALIADSGSLLLFEQPELHLHPRVQALLADFFIAVTRAGKQCILETHSEYLVNQLRLRVAETPLNGNLHDQIMMYFVERSQDKSEFKQVAMNEYGAVPDWPKGFFDQGPTQAARIVTAAIAKRKLADAARSEAPKSR